MEEANGVVALLEQTELAVGALSDSTGTIVALLGGIGALVGGSKRAGGARFVALTEMIRHGATLLRSVSVVVQKVGEVVAELGNALQAIYDGIKQQQQATK